MNEVRNIIIGFQLGKKTSQICYYDRKQQEPVSLTTKAGSTLYEFPTVLCKCQDEGNWHFGIEAEYFQRQGGTFVDTLYQINETDEGVQIDGVYYEPWELLGIFFKESLNMLGVQDLARAVLKLTVTVERLTQVIADNLKHALGTLGLTKEQYKLQNDGESFYYYTMCQKPELHAKKAALWDFDKSQGSFRELKIGSGTRPELVSLSEKKIFTMSDTPEAWDRDFLHAIEQMMTKDGYSAVYLVGNGFKKDWAVNSLAYMRKTARKLFWGNNLYAKGACYAAKESCEEKGLRAYLYVGEDLVRTNVGMEMIVHGMTVYYPLVQAGKNWYDIEHSCDIILDGRTNLIFLSGSMNGGEKKQYVMELPELPQRPNKATRLRLEVSAVSAEQCHIRVKDMGFGEMFPSSGKTWEDCLSL